MHETKYIYEIQYILIIYFIHRIYDRRDKSVQDTALSRLFMLPKVDYVSHNLSFLVQKFKL